MRVLSLYGRSENLVTTTCSVDDDVSRALTSDGAAVPGAEVKIVDLEGNEVPRGTEGDIAYRGPAHMIEYLANPEETAALFTAEGFSRSGDLGVMTDDGYVRVTGRTKDIVIRGGMNISVREIEDNLADHPALQASSCVGMPDERLGERVCCYVVAKPGHTPPTVEDLREFLLARGMPIQKTPERVVAVESLPMTATGKVLKHELRKDIERRIQDEAGANPGSFGCPLMDLKDSPAEAEFRAKARGWLENTLPTLGGPEPPVLEDKLDYWRAWQRLLYGAGYAGLSWPKEYGGGGADAKLRAVFNEELDRAGAPERLNIVGEDFAGPTIIQFGTAGPARALPRIDPEGR